MVGCLHFFPAVRSCVDGGLVNMGINGKTRTNSLLALSSDQVDNIGMDIHSFLLDVTPAGLMLYGIQSAAAKPGFGSFVRLLSCGHDDNAGTLLDQTISRYSGHSELSVTVVVDLPGDLIHEHLSANALSRVQLLKTYIRNLRLLPSIQRMHHGRYPHRVRMPVCGRGIEPIRILASLLSSDALSADSTANRWLGQLRLFALGSDLSSFSWYPWLVQDQKGQRRGFHVRAIYPASLLLGELLDASQKFPEGSVLVFHDAVTHSRHSLFVHRQLVFTRLIERSTDDFNEQLNQLSKTLDYLQGEGLVESLSKTDFLLVGGQNSILASKLSITIGSKVAGLKVLDCDNSMPLRGLLLTTDPVIALALPVARNRSVFTWSVKTDQRRLLQRINCLSEELRVNLRKRNREKRLLISGLAVSMMMFCLSLYLVVDASITGYQIRHLESELNDGRNRENELFGKTARHKHDAFMMRDIVSLNDFLGSKMINPIDVVQKIAVILNLAEYVSLNSLIWKTLDGDQVESREQGLGQDASIRLSTSMLERIQTEDDVDPSPRAQLSLVNSNSDAKGRFVVWLDAELEGSCASVPDCYSQYQRFLELLRSDPAFTTVVEVDDPFAFSGRSTFLVESSRESPDVSGRPSIESSLVQRHTGARRFRIFLVAEK